MQHAIYLLSHFPVGTAITTGNLAELGTLWPCVENAANVWDNALYIFYENLISCERCLRSGRELAADILGKWVFEYRKKKDNGIDAMGRYHLFTSRLYAKSF